MTGAAGQASFRVEGRSGLRTVPLASAPDMRIPAILLPVCMALAVPAVSHAQGGGRLVPYAALAVGRASLPGQFQACDPGYRISADARLGVARGALALEAHLGALAGYGMVMCANALADPAIPTDGVHTFLSYPFRGDDSHLAGDVRLRLGGTRALPLAVSGGAGWLSPTGVPYLLAGAGARFGGRVRLALDVERNWYRVERTAHTAEWRAGRVYRTISRDEQVAWLDGTGVRAGVELAFR